MIQPRRIYEQNFGPIPKEPNGRTYDIHHIDGNHDNNNPKNLKAVTIREHFNIHYTQGDWFACWMIAQRLKLDPKIISELARTTQTKEHREKISQLQKERIANKTHVFCLIDQSLNQRKLVEQGRHSSVHSKSNEIKSIKMSSKYWWNNGIENLRCEDCPGEGFYKGRLSFKKCQ